MLYQGRNWVDG
jgi:CCR4-NOT transcription complex subunit 7/8